MKINWKVRFKNPVFWGQLVLAVFTPILAYAGLTAKDITSWPMVGKLLYEVVANPYVLSLVVVSVFNALNDPTTSGLSDSKQALGYEKPKKDGDL